MKSPSLIVIILVRFFLPRALAENRANIVGGVEVDPKGRYPFQVAMIDGEGEQVCGGSLVDRDWVLCAAHCYGYAARVNIGQHDLSDDNESFENIKIDWEIRHPDYNYRTVDNDFMMVKLQQSSTNTPVTLDNGTVNLDAGVNVTVMGWGDTFFQGPSSNVLLEAEVDIVSNSDCESAYPGEITDNMVCASRAGKDSCQGDSGGPLIVKGVDASGDSQVGIVSFGKECANDRYPGVYARVSSQISWINEQIVSGTRPVDSNDDDNSNDDPGWGDDNWCMRSFLKSIWPWG